MSTIFKNWKTTLAGIVALLTVISKYANAGHLENSDYAMASAGIGLLLSKDHNAAN